MKLAAIVANAVVWALLSGCTAAPVAPVLTLEAVAFKAAIGDASGQSPANVYDRLFAIADDNPKLVWRNPATRKQIKVVSLMSQAAYDKYYRNTPGGVTGGVYAWVTLAPQIQEFCRATGLADDDLKTRLRQHLGLVPDRPYDMFVELWVDRSDLFRPCPDPETDDAACNVAFPVAGGLPVAPTVRGVDDYLGWYNTTYAEAYAPGGAPWTRLGYTYDWNPGTPKFGASEYLITKGAVWEVAGAAPIDTYCGK